MSPTLYLCLSFLLPVNGEYHYYALIVCVAVQFSAFYARLCSKWLPMLSDATSIVAVIMLDVQPGTQILQFPSLPTITFHRGHRLRRSVKCRSVLIPNSCYQFMYESFCSICKAACIIPRYSLTEPLLFSPTVVALFSVLFVATQVFCSVSTLEPQEMTGEVDQNIQFYVIFSVFNRAVSTKYNRIWYIILFYNITMMSWI